MSSLLHDLIQVAKSHGASDLFLSEGSLPRARINGQIMECGKVEMTHEEMVQFWKKCGADPDTQLDRDAAFQSEEGVRFRVNLHRRLGLLSAVMRQVKDQVPNLESLGLPEHVVVPWLQRSSGLLLITGPTGSGKSTTLASGLEWINTYRSCHIVTIEDPIEFLFTDRRSFFTQREVGTDTKDFASGLRSSLRQAPDVIFLGEIRDAETAITALQAAETGHLVFATLHSSSVADTLDRFVHLVPATEREGLLGLLAYQLIGILTQQLLPNAAGDGMALICEHLDVVAAARDWVREMKTAEIEDFMRRGDNPNNQLYLTGLIKAYQAGQITYETALAHCGNPYEFNRALRGIS